MKKILSILYILPFMSFLSKDKPNYMQQYKWDSVSMKLDSVRMFPDKLNLNLSIFNYAVSDITIVKPTLDFLDFNKLSIDVINNNDFKKGYNTNQISKNLQLDKVIVNDSSQLLILKPFDKASFEISIPKSFFQRDDFFLNLKNCHLIVWYEHDVSSFTFKVPVKNVYDGILSSKSSSTVIW